MVWYGVVWCGVTYCGDSCTAPGAGYEVEEVDATFPHPGPALSLSAGDGWSDWTGLDARLER